MPETSDTSSPIRNWVGLILFGMLAILLMISSMRALMGPDVLPENIKTHKMHGTLAEIPEIYGTRTPKNTRLLLNEYPYRSFNIDGIAFNASKWGMMASQMHRGDTVYLEVAKEDYEENIRHVDTPQTMLAVAVFAFRTNCCTFLTLEQYCKEENDDTVAGITCLILAVIAALCTVMGIRKVTLKPKA